MRRYAPVLLDRGFDQRRSTMVFFVIDAVAYEGAYKTFRFVLISQAGLIRGIGYHAWQRCQIAN